MVEKPKRRSRSSSSSSSSSGSSSSSSGSSSSSASRSPTPKKPTKTTGRDERPPRRSPPPRRSRSRSPRRVQAKTEKTTVSSSRRSPSPARRRQVSPVRHRSRSPRRSRATPPARERRSPSPARRQRTPEPPPRRICVRNLSRNISKAHLEEIFTLYGGLKSCELPMDRLHTYLPRGYGYVEYEKSEDAEKALKHMDGAQVDGMEIQCEMTLQYRNSGRGNSPMGAAGIKRERERSRSPRRTSGRAASPPRRMRRSRSPPPQRGVGSGANTIPLGTNGRYRPSSPRR